MSTKPALTRHLSSDEPRVLVVDGSRVVRRLIEQMLKSNLPGVIVLACETGAEAMAQLSAGVIDFVTMALRLPDMDGLELARQIRESSPQAYMPIVVVSGDVQERL
ncbi:MAG: response regulator, partial [Dokdonella sp.]